MVMGLAHCPKKKFWVLQGAMENSEWFSIGTSPLPVGQRFTGALDHHLSTNLARDVIACLVVRGNEDT